MFNKATLSKSGGVALLFAVCSLFLTGCGGGGGSSSSSTTTSSSSSTTSTDPTIFGAQTSAGVQHPALLVSSTLGTELSYQGVQKIIPQSTLLYQTASLSYTSSLEPSYLLTSVKPIVSYADNGDTTLSSLAIDGVVYLHDGAYLSYVDGKTFKETQISPVLTNYQQSTVSGSFCGFWNQSVKKDTSRYFIYMSSDALCSYDYSKNSSFFIGSTSDTAATVPNLLGHQIYPDSSDSSKSQYPFHPLAALTDGWLIYTSPTVGKVEIWLCNVDCSSSQKLTTLDAQYARPFASNAKYNIAPLGLGDTKYHLVSLGIITTTTRTNPDGTTTDETDPVYVYNETDKSFTQIDCVKSNSSDCSTPITLPSKSSLIAEDDTYYYFPHNEGSTSGQQSAASSLLTLVDKQNVIGGTFTSGNVHSVNLKTLFQSQLGSSQTFSFQAIAATKNYLFMQIQVGTSSSGTNYILSIPKAKLPDSVASSDVHSLVDTVSCATVGDGSSDATSGKSGQVTLTLFDVDWSSDTVLYNCTSTTSGTTTSTSSSSSATSVAHNYYGWVNGNGDTSQKYASAVEGAWLSSVLSDTTNADYIPVKSFVNVGNQSSLYIYAASPGVFALSNPTSQNGTGITIGKLSGSQFDVGLFSGYGTTTALMSKATGANVIYRIDTQTAGSLTCFFNCTN